MKPVLIGLSDADRAHLEHYGLVENNSLQIINNENNIMISDMEIDSKSFFKAMYNNLPEIKYDYSDKPGERKSLTNKQKKKKKSNNKQARNSRKQNRK